MRREIEKGWLSYREAADIGRKAADDGSSGAAALTI